MQVVEHHKCGPGILPEHTRLDGHGMRGLWCVLVVESSSAANRLNSVRGDASDRPADGLSVGESAPLIAAPRPRPVGIC